MQEIPMTHPVFYFHSLINSGRPRHSYLHQGQSHTAGKWSWVWPPHPSSAQAALLTWVSLMPSDSAEFFTALRCRWGCKAYSSDDPGAGGSSVGITYPRPRSSLQPGLLTLRQIAESGTQALKRPCSPKTALLGGDSDKVNQTSYFSPPAHPLVLWDSCIQPAAKQQMLLFKPPWSCQGSLTDQSLTEITPFWLHKGGLFPIKFGMHVTSEGKEAPVLPPHAQGSATINSQVLKGWGVFPTENKSESSPVLPG